MQIRQIETTNKSDVQRFVRFPFDLYANTPQWVPPLLSDAASMLDRRRHPFFQHSSADFFIAESEGQVVGRVAVMDHRLYNEFHHSQTAFFGLFEVIEDRQISAALFAAVFDWARQRGLQRMIGPKGLLSSDATGVLVKGFEHRPALDIPYNLPYYDHLIRASGFEKDTDTFSGYLDRSHEMPPRLLELAEKVKTRRGFTIKTFSSKAEMRQVVSQVAKVQQEAFAIFPTYIPFTDQEVAKAADTLIAIADPRLIKLVMKEDNVIGFVFAYPDISAALQKCRGRLWPFGWLTILQERKRTRWVNINGIGLLPEYQGLGANVMLYMELVKTLLDSQFLYADIVQVDETNYKSRSDMEAMGVQWYKAHRNYKRHLP